LSKNNFVKKIPESDTDIAGELNTELQEVVVVVAATTST
jgi:hypothetical protein